MYFAVKDDDDDNNLNENLLHGFIFIHQVCNLYAAAPQK